MINKPLFSLLEAGVMVFAIIANLASHGSQIVVEKVTLKLYQSFINVYLQLMIYI